MSPAIQEDDFPIHTMTHAKPHTLVLQLAIMSTLCRQLTSCGHVLRVMVLAALAALEVKALEVTS